MGNNDERYAAIELSSQVRVGLDEEKLNMFSRRFEVYASDDSTFENQSTNASRSLDSTQATLPSISWSFRVLSKNDRDAWISSINYNCSLTNQFMVLPMASVPKLKWEVLASVQSQMASKMDLTSKKLKGGIMIDNTFSGSDAISFLVRERIVNSRQEAIQLGQVLVHSGFIHHVVYQYDFQDTKEHFKFSVHLCFESEEALFSSRNVDRRKFWRSMMILKEASNSNSTCRTTSSSAPVKRTPMVKESKRTMTVSSSEHSITSTIRPIANSIDALPNNTTVLNIVIKHDKDLAPLSSATHCKVCVKKFGAFRRKHNCTVCGHVICRPCSRTKTISLAAEGSVAIRMCNPCFVHHLSTIAQKDSCKDCTLQNCLPIQSPTSLTYNLEYENNNPWPCAPFTLDNAHQEFSLAQAHESLTDKVQASLDHIMELAIIVSGCSHSNIQLFNNTDCAALASMGNLPLPSKRSDAMGAFALLSSEAPIVCNDTALDIRFKHYPLVATHGVRFYVAYPIVLSDEHIVGVLEVMDLKPHESCSNLSFSLQRIAAMASKEVEVHLFRKSALSIDAAELNDAVGTPGNSPPCTPSRSNSISPINYTSLQDAADGISTPSSVCFDNERLLLTSHESIVPKSYHHSDSGSSTEYELADEVLSVSKKVLPDNTMQDRLALLLTRTTDTQSQLSKQQGQMVSTLGDHGKQLELLANQLERLEAATGAK